MMNNSLQVWAVGSNSLGALGLGDLEDRHEFTRVHFDNKDTKCLQIATAGQHALSLFAAPDGVNQIYTWGLAESNDITAAVPAQVDTEVKSVRSVACGWDISFFITAEGQLYSWDATHGSLAELSRIRQPLGRSCHCSSSPHNDPQGSKGPTSCQCRRVPTPVNVYIRADVLEVSAGWRHAVCIVRDSDSGERSVYGWGCNRNLQLGHIETPSEDAQGASKLATSVTTTSTRPLAAEASHADMRLSSAQGIRKRRDRSTNEAFFTTPVRLSCTTNLTQSDCEVDWEPMRIACGWRHTLVLMRSRQSSQATGVRTRIYAMGERSHADWRMFGYIDDTCTTPSAGPVSLFSSEPDESTSQCDESKDPTCHFHQQWHVVDIASGHFHAAAIVCKSLDYASETCLITWGRCTLGQLGHTHAFIPGMNSALPHVVDSIAPIMIACGSDHTLAVTTSQDRTYDELWSWGWNEHGTLGIPRTAPKTVEMHPTRVLVARHLHSKDSGQISLQDDDEEADIKVVQGTIRGVCAGGAISFVLIEDR